MDTTDKNQEPSGNSHTTDTSDSPKIKGVGTASVNGETIYDGVSNFSDKVSAEVDSAHASAKGATENSGGAKNYGYHYPGQQKVQTAKDSRASKGFASWGIWVGVILVSLGSLIFLDMLSSTVPALENIFGGYSFWSFWPILIIFGGLAMAFSPTSESPDPKKLGKMSALRFLEGMFYSTIGIVLLGNSLGYVAWGSWLAMLSFWPILLVVGGLAILSYGLKTQWFSVLAFALSIFILLAVAASMWIGPHALAEPLSTLAQIGSFRGIDIFNIGSTIGSGFDGVR